MKTITRYIFIEILKTFLIAIVALTLVLIIGVLVKEAVSKGIPAKHVIKLIPFVTIKMSPISLPMALLMAVTTFFAKMSANNEIIALKSLGISPWRLLWPVMIFGTIVSLGAVWINEMAVTYGRAGMEGIIYAASEDILLEQLRREHSFQANNNLEIMVQGVENRRLISPIITQKKEGTRLEAQEAELKIDFLEQKLTIDLYNIKGVVGNNRYVGKHRAIPIALDAVLNLSDSKPKSASEKSLWEIPAEMAEHQEVVDAQRRSIAAARAFASTMGTVDAWSTPLIQRMKHTINTELGVNDRLSVESPRRWAAGFACLFFVWLGAPMAIWVTTFLKTSDTFTSFFACFIPVLLLYYPLLMFGLEGAKNGTLPANFVWTANTCMMLAGAWFLKRIHRY